MNFKQFAPNDVYKQENLKQSIKEDLDEVKQWRA